MKFRNDVIKGLYDYLLKPVILSPQGQNRPPYPFIGYTVISADNEESEYLQNELTPGTEFEYDIKATLKTQVINTLSFTSYSDKENEAYSLARNAMNWFNHIGYDYSLEKDFVIVDVLPLENRDQLEVDKYVRRWGFDVIIRIGVDIVRIDSTIETYTIKREE
jgi:hypothetical protein